MLFKTKVLFLIVQVIDLLYPHPSQLLLSRIIAGYQVKNSKRTSRTRELEINMSI